MSNDLGVSFERLLGRQPSDAERQELYRVRDALDLKNNDALWLVLIALQHYQDLYKGIPADIERASRAAASGAAERAQGQISEAVGQLVPSVSEAVQRAAHTAMAKVEVGKSALTLAAAGVMMGLVMLLAMSLGSNLPIALANGQAQWRDVILMIGLLGGAGAAAPGLFLLAFSGNYQDGWPDRPWKWLCMGLGMFVVAGLLMAGIILIID